MALKFGLIGGKGGLGGLGNANGHEAGGGGGGLILPSEYYKGIKVNGGRG